MAGPFDTPDDIQAENRAAALAGSKATAQLARDYRETFAGRAGQAVLDDLIARFAGQSYTQGDPHHTAWREGQRSVVERIAQMVGLAEKQDRNNGETDAIVE